MQAILTGVLAVLLAVIATSALPDAATSAADRSQSNAETIRVPALHVARVLMNAERWQEARSILTALKSRNEEERIERLFLLGLAEVRLGLLPEAAERFEAILAIRPDLTRVRLELARIYHLLGRDQKARFHFEASLGDELPSSVEGAVEAFLDRIDARKRWSVSLSLAALPESNPVKRTDREEVRIGGASFRLNQDAREASGTGLLFSTGAQYSPVLSDDWRGVLAASGAAKLYEQSDWNDISVRGDIGVARLFHRGSVSGGLRIGRRWLGGDRYSDGNRPLGAWPSAAVAGATARRRAERGAPRPSRATGTERLDLCAASRPGLCAQLADDAPGQGSTSNMSKPTRTVTAVRLGGLRHLAFPCLPGRSFDVASDFRSLAALCGRGPAVPEETFRPPSARFREPAPPGAAISRFRPLCRLFRRAELVQHPHQQLPQPRRCVRGLEDILEVCVRRRPQGLVGRPLRRVRAERSGFEREPAYAA